MFQEPCQVCRVCQPAAERLYLRRSRRAIRLHIPLVGVTVNKYLLATFYRGPERKKRIGILLDSAHTLGNKQRV